MFLYLYKLIPKEQASGKGGKEKLKERRNLLLIKFAIVLP